jgi:hypothetical protein
MVEHLFSEAHNRPSPSRFSECCRGFPAADTAPTDDLSPAPTGGQLSMIQK